jgi:hypothetical protein
MNRLVMALLTTLAAPAFAAEAEIIGRLDPAWKEMEARVTRLLGQTGQRQLLDMAYAQVAVDACPGLRLKEKAYEEGFSRLAGSAKRAPAEQRKFENEMMADFGVYTGLVLAESFLDKPAFCLAVGKVRDKSGGPSRFWTRQ